MAIAAALPRPQRLPLVPAMAAAVLLAGAALVLVPGRVQGAEPAISYSAVVKAAAPSVVTVSTAKTVERKRLLPPWLQQEPMMRRFFGFGGPEDEDGDVQRQRQSGLGSGVVVSADGYILTNNHVVDGADDIRVGFDHGRGNLLAKLVGTDPKTDIAVLKIEAKDLPVMPLGDSDAAQVGDVVLAIGNPFGVGQTVTMGIISARGRGVGLADYEDFIQTDASINPGNSGGALVDAHGRLIGINTAILSPSGGNLGIGFAVPINLAKGIKDSLIAHGTVVRGFLGLMIQPVTPELAKAFKLSDDAGALVGDVVADGPAAAAGVKAGDVVVAYDGRPVEDPRSLRLMAAATAPGTKVVLALVRDGKRVEIPVVLKDLAGSPGGTESEGAAEPHGKAHIGLAIGRLDDAMRQRLRVPEAVEGAVVAEVKPGSPAEAAGIRPGDVIVEIDRTPVSGPAPAQKLLLAADGPVVLRLWSKGGMRYVVIEPSRE